jgi:hypothetical protein
MGTTIFGVDTFVPLFVQGARRHRRARRRITPLVFLWAAPRQSPDGSSCGSVSSDGPLGAVLILGCSVSSRRRWVTPVPDQYACALVGAGLGPMSIAQILAIQYTVGEKSAESRPASSPFSRSAARWARRPVESSAGWRGAWEARRVDGCWRPGAPATRRRWPRSLAGDRALSPSGLPFFWSRLRNLLTVRFRAGSAAARNEVTGPRERATHGRPRGRTAAGRPGGYGLRAGRRRRALPSAFASGAEGPAFVTNTTSRPRARRIEELSAMGSPRSRNAS